MTCDNKQYTFINDHCGNETSYYYFITNATYDEIMNATEEMDRECPWFGRTGSGVMDLCIKLLDKGFHLEKRIEHIKKPNLQLYPAVKCISGNY